MGSMIEDAFAWLYGLQQFGIKLGLDGIRALLSDLGNPERSAPSILVGGTNGKGSVAAMLDSMLGASGLRVGLYTSPHLVRPNERIRIAGRDLPSEELAFHLGEVRRACERLLSEGALSAHPSFFEVMTAAAWSAFRAKAVEVAVLEVGLGGRLDATNVSPAIVSVVVTIDLDHMDRLGATLPEIAAEKAGIVKEGRPLVSGVVQEEAASVLRLACARAGALFVDVHAEAPIEERGARFTLRTESGAYDDLALPLPGAHQRENARVAVVALERVLQQLDRPVTVDAVRRGLGEVRWPGRLHWIEGMPPLLLDGAHNPSGAASLADYLRARSGPRPVWLLGVMRGKDPRGIVEALAPHVCEIVLTRPSVDRAEDPAVLSELASDLGLQASIVPDVRAALAEARRRAGRSFVLVAGSLYLVGEVLAALEGTDAPGPVPM
jgi:dihydrofolate synthase/folylpolyglutamate synthase